MFRLSSGRFLQKKSRPDYILIGIFLYDNTTESYFTGTKDYFSVSSCRYLILKKNCSLVHNL